MWTQSIVCATDFSTVGHAAVMAAAALADMLGTEEIWLVHALDLTSLQLAGMAFEQARDQAEAALAKGAKQLQDLTTRTVRSALLYGPAAGAVCEFAEHRNAGLLVVASKGHGGSLLLRLGSTSEQITEQTRTPVLVVRDSTPLVQWRVSGKPLRILLGVNHTSNWDSCLELVRRLRRAAACDVTVGMIYYANEERDRYGLADFHSMDEPDREVEALLTRDSEARITGFEGAGEIRYVASRGVGRIGDHLIQLAKEQSAEIIALGTHQRTGVSRLSSVSNVVLHYADPSVLVVPPLRVAPGGRVRSPRVVLAASDLSDPSKLALTQAFGLIEGRPDGRVVLYHVVEPDENDPLAVTNAQQVLRAIVPSQYAAVTSIDVECAGDVSTSIARAAERHGADVICVASRGRSALSRALLGSVARSVLERAERPVLVVKPLPR